MLHFKFDFASKKVICSHVSVSNKHNTNNVLSVQDPMVIFYW